MNKKLALMASILIAGTAISYNSIRSSSEDLASVNGIKDIEIRTERKSADGNVVVGNTVHSLDLENKIVRTVTNGDLGGVEVYYKMKPNKVDVYMKNSDENKFTLYSDLNVSETALPSILSLFDIEETYADVVEVSKETKDDKILSSDNVNRDYNTMMVNAKKEFKKVSKLNDNSLVTKDVLNFKEKADKIEIQKDVSSDRVESAKIDQTEFSILSHLMNGEDANKMPTKVEHDIKYNYGSEETIKLPIVD